MATPEASLRHFLEVMTLANPLRPDLYILGSRHLDLSELPTLVREERGMELARQLFAVLSAIALDSTGIVGDPEVDEVALYRQPSGDRIVLQRQADGRWIFSADTVRSVPHMHSTLAAKGRLQLPPAHTVFDGIYWGVTGRVWFILLVLPLLSYLAGCLSVFVLRGTVGRLATQRYGLSEESDLKPLFRPLGWLTASLVFWLGLCFLALPDGLLLVLVGLVKVATTLAALTAIFRLSDIVGQYAHRRAIRNGSPFDEMLVPLVRRSFKILVGSIGALLLAQNLDIEVWSLFAGFSIFGAMVALAGQDMVKNIFGSVTVLGDRPFAVGDWIVVEGLEGMVEEVGFRSTRIRTFYDSLITLPNSRLLTASVDNYGRRQYRRYTKKLQVRWNTSPQALEAFCEGVRELVREHPYTRKDNYQVWVNDVSDYALEILIYIFFAAPDWGTELRERHRFLIDVHRLANELGIELAYPSQKLLVSRAEQPAEEGYDRELYEQAVHTGRTTTQAMLSRSLPLEKPGPMRLDGKGQWVG